MAKKLTPLEKVQANPALWLKNFVKIVDPEGNTIPFTVNPEQKDFLDNHGRYNCILKSRQLGFSTLALGLMLWSSHMLPNSNYLMLCQDSESTQNLFTKLKLMYESIPDKHRIPFRKNNEMELFLENGSRISVKIASKHKELGRGFTCQMIHCSEFAFWAGHVQKNGLLALEQALNKNPNAMIIIESTANGLNYFHQLYMRAYRGNSKYKAFFYSWFGKGAKKMFKTEIQLAMDWYNKGIFNQLRSEDLDEYERKLQKDGATLRQLTWRKWKLQDLKLNQFNQEFPSYPEEAFINTHEGVFDAKVIGERFNYLPRPLEEKELYKPLPDVLSQYIGKNLFIYEQVKTQEVYFGGVDTSAGLSKAGDMSAINILDSLGQQVGVFYSSGIPVYKFCKIVYEMGMYFNYCMYMIERNSYGLDLIHRLRKEMGYLQILKTFKWDKITGRRSYEYGWNTDNTNKAKLVNDFKEAFEEGVIVINDRETLDEMKIYQEKNGKFANIRGEQNYDDVLDATMLSLQSMKANKSYL